MQQFKVGDHVIVDEGDYLDNGLDGVVESTYDTYGGVVVRGWSTILHRTAARYYSDPSALIKVDDLVTGPFAPGDRAIVVSNTKRPDGIWHYIEVGTDVEITSGPRLNDGRVLYQVRGAGQGHVITQRVAACDLEAEPTFNNYVTFEVFDAKPYVDVISWYAAERAIDYGLTPAGWALDEHGTTDRAAALRDAVELFGADTDGAKLVEVAEWLLSGKVPA